MMTTSINLNGEQINPSGDVLTLDPGTINAGESFIVFRFMPELDVILPGFGAEAVASARALAAKLTELADECEGKDL
jgi:hypothetical protein